MSNATPGNSEEPRHLRLTLRTLLAYLDDVLEPTAAKEIGTKIQETEYASQLVDRIQEVLRRRRVAAPDLRGPGSGLDPNTVAEYLDNTLPPASVPDVERVCLESDQHLAEVAACHQILTLVLSDPLHVSGESRARLHALIPSALAQPASTAPKPSPEPIRQTAAAMAPAASQPVPSQMNIPQQQPSRKGGMEGSGVSPAPSKNFSESIPDYLKPKPMWKRVFVPALVVLALMAWLGLLIFDPSLLGGNGNDENKEVAQLDPKTDGAKLSPSEKSPEKVTSTTPEKSSEPPETITPEKSPEKTPAEDMVIDETPPPDKQPEVPGDQVASTDGSKDPVTIPMPIETTDTTPPEKTGEGTPTETTETTDNTPPNTTDPVTDLGRQVLYKTGNSKSPVMLLHRGDASQKWEILPQAFVNAGEKLACPEPLVAPFKLSNPDCDMFFVGGVMASFHPAEAPAQLGIQLDRGRVVFANADDETPVTFAIKLGSHELTLQLAAANTKCGLEVIPKFPTKFEAELGPHWYHAKIWVETGRINVIDYADRSYQVTAQQMLNLTPDALDPEQLEPTPPLKRSSPVAPDWFTPETRRLTEYGSPRLVERFQKAFTEVDEQLVLTEELWAVAKQSETDEAVSVMIIKMLAMTGCLSETVSLMALEDDQSAQIREAAIAGTREWLTLHHQPEHRDALLKALEANFDQAAEVMYRLLWGFQRADLEDQAELPELIDHLSHDNVAVRTLAIQELSELTGKTNAYRPLDRESDRLKSIDRWKRDYESNRLFD